MKDGVTQTGTTGKPRPWQASCFDALKDLIDLEDVTVDYLMHEVGSFDGVHDHVVDTVDVSVTNDEVRVSLFDIAPAKAPGVDGLHLPATFFKHDWVADRLWVQLLRDNYNVMDNFNAIVKMQWVMVVEESVFGLGGFHEMVDAHRERIKPPLPLSSVDRPCWRWESKYNFTIASACWICKQ
ncbi:hypothetical protein V6N13_003390 [Hibiscus sabdariffa]